MKIRTDFVYPPIPIRQFDWSATTDDYDGAPDAGPQLVGYGATEEEAIADLKEQIDEDCEVCGSPLDEFEIGLKVCDFCAHEQAHCDDFEDDEP